jgi:hypothetical protein
MAYYFINTDAKSLGNNSPHDLWFRYGFAFSGGPIKYGQKFERLSPDDTLLMYANGLGVVGVGIVKEMWDGNSYKEGEQLVYVEPYPDVEYRIKADWCLDMRQKPLDPFKEFSYTPRGTLTKIEKHLVAVQRFLVDSAKTIKANEYIEVVNRKTGGNVPGPTEEGDHMAEGIDEIKFDEGADEANEEIVESITQQKIFSDKGDPEIDSLHKRFKKGKLDIQPNFQRQYVWDNIKASRLIESILLDIPLPIIYLSEEEDGRTYVIDGQQRLTSLFGFIDGKHPDGKTFKLVKSNVFPALNGKTFRELPDDLQDKITCYKLRTITFLKDSAQNLKYVIFERLNSGSVSLNDQELRNCIYRGPYNELLKELSYDPDFRFLLGIQRPDKRMKDVELVLRFAAFYHSTYLNYKSPMKNFLNLDADKFRNAGREELNELQNAFKNACLIIRSLFGKEAFRRFYRGTQKDPNGWWETTAFNASLYDIMMGTFAKENKNTVFQHLDSIREALIDLMTSDEEFIESIELSTSSLQAVTKRFDKWRFALQSVIGIGRKEPRCFSRTLKDTLFQANPTCAICNNQISDIDDAAIDHIKQYWEGGKTIPENARLAHRYCNWARPRKESNPGI